MNYKYFNFVTLLHFALQTGILSNSSYYNLLKEKKLKYFQPIISLRHKTRTEKENRKFLIFHDQIYFSVYKNDLP